jgi:hypothetical protein
MSAQSHPKRELPRTPVAMAVIFIFAEVIQ